MKTQTTKTSLHATWGRAGALLLACTLLSACGGSGGGGEAAPAPATAAQPSLREQIAAMENSGAYPKLDRSDSMAGPDANGNGVRDDIEAWINAQPVTDVQKKALLQSAKTLQRTLLVDLNDKQALQQVGEGLMASTKCAGDNFPKRSDSYIYTDKIEAMTSNTRQRAERYMKYNAARSGSSTTYPNGDTCEP